MFKHITKIDCQDLEVWHIISEPGDATHYDYIVMRNYDDYMFMPYNNSFRYPQRINKYELDDGLIISKRENSNPYTVAECILTIRTLEEK